MDFSGWEKLSLLDYDDHLSTTLFMAGCDFRCPFCHNSSLVLDPKSAPIIKWADIMDYLKKRTGVLEAVVITGGEPTLMPDLEDKIKDIKALGYEVKLDTNGSHPEVVKNLVSKNLIDYLAMDIKNSPKKYPMTIGTTNVNMDKINETIDFLIHGSLRFEFRTTTIAEYHDEQDFEEIGQWIKGAKNFFIQRYIDNENCIAHGLHMVDKETATKFMKIMEKYVSHVALRGYD
jgi:pyruvate formate lyase activating enzyme